MKITEYISIPIPESTVFYLRRGLVDGYSGEIEMYLQNSIDIRRIGSIHTSLLPSLPLRKGGITFHGVRIDEPVYIVLPQESMLLRSTQGMLQGSMLLRSSQVGSIPLEHPEEQYVFDGVSDKPSLADREKIASLPLSEEVKKYLRGESTEYRLCLYLLTLLLRGQDAPREAFLEMESILSAPRLPPALHSAHLSALRKEMEKPPSLPPPLLLLKDEIIPLLSKD